MSKFMAKMEAEERNIILDAHNVSMDNFCRSPATTNTQGQNENTILTSKRIHNLDALTEKLKGLKINDTGYYNSGKNHAEGDLTSTPKVYDYASDGKKRKVTYTSNRNLQQTLVINRNLPIMNKRIYPQINDRVATSGASTIKIATPHTVEVITDAALRSARVL